MALTSPRASLGVAMPAATYQNSDLSRFAKSAGAINVAAVVSVLRHCDSEASLNTSLEQLRRNAPHLFRK